MTIARSCYFNGVLFFDYMIWLHQELLKRSREKDPSKEFVMLKPQIWRYEDLPESEKEYYKDKIIEEKGQKLVEVGLFDPLYKGPFDDIDRTGLSIIDYKLKCLNFDTLSKEDQEEILNIIKNSK